MLYKLYKLNRKLHNYLSVSCKLSWLTKHTTFNIWKLFPDKWDDKWLEENSRNVCSNTNKITIQPLTCIFIYQWIFIAWTEDDEIKTKLTLFPGNWNINKLEDKKQLRVLIQEYAGNPNPELLQIIKEFVKEKELWVG